MSDGEQWQAAAPYPEDFIEAVQPGEVTTNGCDHEADPPVCTCVHDWRINWGNEVRRSTVRPRTAVL